MVVLGFRVFGSALLAFLVVLPSVARAENLVVAADVPQFENEVPFVPLSERRFGLAAATMAFRYVHARDPVSSGLSDLFLAGLSARAVYGKRFGYGAGLGFELGASSAPGFAFGCDLYPAGVAISLGPTGFLGAFFGLGVNGVTARLPYAFVLPAELRLEVDFTRRARLGAVFGLAWTPANDARANGSLMVPFADETLLGISARYGKTFPKYEMNVGRGYWFRLERREQMKTVFFGVSFGVEIDVAY